MRLIILLLCSLALATAAEPFTLVIKTDNPGGSASNAFTLPLFGGPDCDLTIAWGDGTSETVTTSSNLTHAYPAAGTYSVAITENVPGGFPHILFGGGGDCQKVLAIAKWGDVTWSSLYNAFSGCTNLTITATDEATAKTGNVTDFQAAWTNCSSLTSFPMIDTSSGTNFIQTWQNCTGLTSFPAIDTSAGVTFDAAWLGCSGLTSFPSLDTSAGMEFSWTWGLCTGLTSFPALDLSNATDLYATWFACSGLTTFPLLSFPAVESLDSTWANCSGLTAFPLIDTSAVTDFSSAWYRCTGLTSFPLIDTSAGTSFFTTWTGCTGLTSFPLIDTSAGTDFYGVFYDCSALVDIPAFDLRSMTNGDSFVGLYAAIPSDSYSAILNNLAANNPNTSVVFLAGLNSRYRSSASTARNTVLIGTRGWSITDGGLEPPEISSATTVVAQVGSAFAYQIIASNAPTNYTAAPLPAGLSIDGMTGAISGTTPTTIGIHVITLAAYNDGGGDDASLTLYVNDAGAPVITSAATAAGTVGKAFRYRITATGAPTGFTAVGLPAGLSLDAGTGRITGKPTTAGTTAITVTATNVHGTGPATLTITIAAADDDSGSDDKCGMGGGISTFLLILSFGLHRMIGRRRRIED